MDLAPNGVNLNGNDTGATGANASQNYPVLASAAGGANAGQVSGTLQSANGTYEISIYRSTVCDPSGHGEGRAFIGAATVTISNGTANADGTASFTANVVDDSIDLDGNPITAMAARRGGPGDGNTSEFSACIEYASVELFDDGFEP